MPSPLGSYRGVVDADARLERLRRTLSSIGNSGERISSGKAMIVCMSRRICVDLYAKIVGLRPEWHSDDPEGGAIKVIMTGSAADPQRFQPHLHSKDDLRKLKARCKNPSIRFSS